LRRQVKAQIATVSIYPWDWKRNTMNLIIKGVLLAIIGLLLGVAGAWAFLQFQIASSKEQFFSGQWPRSSDQPAQSTAVKLEVEGLSSRDLGKLLTGTKTSVDFLLRNPTGEKVKFKLAGAPPAALQIDIPAGGGVIGANSSYPVTVTVTPKVSENKFSKSIIVETEQGAKTVLTVTAQVEGGLGLVNNELVFSRAKLATENVKEAEVVCSTSKSLKSVKLTLDGNSTLPAWLFVESLEMNDDLLSNNPGATSGLVVRVTVGAELPADLKEAKLELVTDQSQYLPQVITLKFDE
jgi:hypothetical protein